MAGCDSQSPDPQSGRRPFSLLTCDWMDLVSGFRLLRHTDRHTPGCRCSPGCAGGLSFGGRAGLSFRGRGLLLFGAAQVRKVVVTG